MRALSQTDTTTKPQGLLNLLTGGVTQQLAGSLPSQQDIIKDYMAATVAFWIVGGVVLYAVGRALRK